MVGTLAQSRTLKRLLSSYVHAGKFGVKGDGTAADAVKIRNAIATGENVLFPGPQPGQDYVIPDGSLPITTPGQRILSPFGRWRVTGRPWPLFDVQTGADGVKIAVDRLFFDQSLNPSWTFADDQLARYVRGGRINGQVSGIYTMAQYGDFRANMIEGFYAACGASNWNSNTNAKDSSTTYRQGNKFHFGFKNVFTGLAFWGQQDLDFKISGSYQQQGVPGQRDDNPPHAFYITSDNDNLNCRGSGYCHDSSGTGHFYELTRLAPAITGGTVAIKLNWKDGVTQTVTVSATATAATVAAAIAALPRVGANMVSVYDLPDSLDTTGTGWRIGLDWSLGSLQFGTGITVDNTGVTPAGAGYQSVEYQPWNSGAPWRFRQLNGGVFGPLESDNTPGSLEVLTACSNLTLQTVRSTNAQPSSGGAAGIFGTNIVVERYEENLAAGFDGRHMNLFGTDCRVLSAAISSNNPTRNTTDPYVVVRGTRNKIHFERITETGAGGRHAVEAWAGDGHEITIDKMSGTLEIGAWLQTGVTNSFVDVDSRRIPSWSPAAVAPYNPWYDTSGQASNRFNRYDLRRRLPGVMLPQEHGWAGIVQAPNVNRAYFQRLYLDQWMLVKTLACFFSGTLTGSEHWDWGIYDQTGAAIWRLGQTVVGAGSNTTKLASVPAAFQYYPGGTILYIGWVMDTAINVHMANWAVGVAMTSELSAVVPFVENMAIDGQTTGLPASMAGTNANQGAVPILGVRST